MGPQRYPQGAAAVDAARARTPSVCPTKPPGWPAGTFARGRRAVPACRSRGLRGLRVAAPPLTASAAGEPRRALLALRGQPLLQVRRRQRHRLGQRLPLQRRLEARVPAAEQRPLVSRVATGAAAATAAAAQRLVEHVFARDRPVDQPDAAASAPVTTRPVSSISRATASPATSGSS